MSPSTCIDMYALLHLNSIIGSDNPVRDDVLSEMRPKPRNLPSGVKEKNHWYKSIRVKFRNPLSEECRSHGFTVDLEKNRKCKAANKFGIFYSYKPGQSFDLDSGTYTERTRTLQDRRVMAISQVRN